MKDMKQTLQDALDLLEGGERWAKGTYKRTELINRPGALTVALAEPDARPVEYETRELYCMVGAVREVLTLPGELYGTVFQSRYREVLAALTAFLPAHEGPTCIGAYKMESPVVNFNDDPTTTFEDVALVFKQTIHALEELDV